MPVTTGTVSETTLDIYKRLGPWESQDATDMLLTLVASIGEQYDVTEQYTRDDPDHIGWGQLLDVDVCPFEALPWLAQFPGVVIPAGSTDAVARGLIRSQANTKRGTPAAIVGAIQPFLTGGKHVTLLERYGGDPYKLKIITYLAETPSGSSAQINAAITGAKPAGLIVSYVVQAGYTWATIPGTWAAQTNTWAGLSNEVPG